MKFRQHTGFVPSQHGFPFPNSFPAGKPVLTLPTPFGKIPIGDASGGVCGGMVFTAIDLFLTKQARPAEANEPVFQYFCRRLLESWDFPLGWSRYFDWQCRPSSSRFFGGVRVLMGVSALTALEWPKIRKVLDSGMPAPLGIVNVQSLNPKMLGKNHQVLACGYYWDDEEQNLSLAIYDPNHPDVDDLTLTTCLADPDLAATVTHSIEGSHVRGFFLTDYRCPHDPLQV